eukprot:10640274-Lingulodinium_polyedra.AAC.1
MAVDSMFVAAVVKQSPEQVLLYSNAFEEWDEELQHEADDPTYVPALKGWSFRHHETQFLSEMAEGIDEWFVCRRLDC